MDYDDSVWIVCAALAVQMVVLLVLTAWFLRRKDVGRAWRVTAGGDPTSALQGSGRCNACHCPPLGPGLRWPL